MRELRWLQAYAPQTHSTNHVHGTPEQPMLPETAGLRNAKQLRPVEEIRLQAQHSDWAALFPGVMLLSTSSTVQLFSALIQEPGFQIQLCIFGS